MRDLKTALARYLVGCAAQFNRSRQDGSDATGESSLGCHGQDDAGPISNKKLVLFEFKNKKLTKFLDDRFEVLFIGHCLDTLTRPIFSQVSAGSRGCRRADTGPVRQRVLCL